MEFSEIHRTESSSVSNISSVTEEISSILKTREGQLLHSQDSPSVPNLHHSSPVHNLPA